MTLYGDHILPRMIDRAMRTDDFAAYRRRLAAQAWGRVLDVGVGAGMNLAYFGPSVSSVIGIDPSAHLLRRARQAATGASAPVDLVRAIAEAIPLRDACIDSIVMTWTLCSVRDARKALAEMRRVLKPDGALFFVEHGLSPDPAVARWQHRCDPLWTKISCHLDNPVATLLREAGFTIDRLETGYMRRWPKTLTYMYEGRARPSD
ncbi:MAG TPA: methyltransferase domain-containing protein [Saliniramus sp.]|nr:methyltransferase domain-containing protein [Saliniramus sp.]